MRSSIKLAFAVSIFAIAGSCLLAAKKTSQLQATAKRFVSDGNATVVWVSAVVRVDVSVAGVLYVSTAVASPVTVGVGIAAPFAVYAYHCRYHRFCRYTRG